MQVQGIEYILRTLPYFDATLQVKLQSYNTLNHVHHSDSFVTLSILIYIEVIKKLVHKVTLRV